MCFPFCNMAVLSGMFSDPCADSLSDSCRNVALLFMFPPVYKEAVLPQRKGNLVPGFTLSLAFFCKVISSTILITASGFVINTHQGLDHFDYVIRVCPYYVIKSYFSFCVSVPLLNFGKQVVVSNDCVTDTTRYSSRSAGLIFDIEFESNLQRLPRQLCRHDSVSGNERLSPANACTIAKASASW